jgi:2-dehydro-3-deoxyphosphooctonate aldolase (KDO 8-P synthase)
MLAESFYTYEKRDERMRFINPGGIRIGSGADRLTLIAGPCVAESEELCMEIAQFTSNLCKDTGLNYIFKASFDKANRTSIHSYRGPGFERGLEILSRVKNVLHLPILTDIHEPWQAEPVSNVADILQIPAFLCRQTDILTAAAKTGKCINIKKGQFLAPEDMKNVVQKAAESGNENLLLTERGVSFGYNRLVVDMYSLPLMRALGYPVCFDATHSVQMPGAAGTQSGGKRDAIPYLARAAAAVGIDALFMEVHPDPAKGLSDAATMYPLAGLKSLLSDVVEIDRVVRSAFD